MGAKKKKRAGVNRARGRESVAAEKRAPFVGFIGAGNMARSLAAGLLRNGWPRARVVLSDPDPRQREAVGASLRLKAYESNAEVARRADVLVLAVKPQALRAAAVGLADAVQAKRPLVVSVAAGVRCADVVRWLGGGLPLVRVMPNTPALIGAGAAALYATVQVDTNSRTLAESLMRAVGVAVWVEDEDLMDAVTALSGSGPAYFLLMMEQLEQAAYRLGLKADTARLLTLQTAYGAAKMALESGEDPAALRLRVTSPGGTTEQAVRALESGGFAALIERAVAAAAGRSRELADMFGQSR